MSSAATVASELTSIRSLVERLVEEHRDFPRKVQGLRDELSRSLVRKRLEGRFVELQDTLTGHMLAEEFEVYPELMKRGLFDQEISGIMQQHHDLTAQLGKMELALRIANFGEFRDALEKLEKVLRVHQPAEEERVFPRAVQDLKPKQSPTLV